MDVPIPKVFQKMLQGYGIDPGDLFLKVKIAYENEKNKEGNLKK